MVLISFICNTHLRNKILICSGSSWPMSVVSEQRQRSIREKEGAREGGASKGDITKKGELLNKDCGRKTNNAHKGETESKLFR